MTGDIFLYRDAKGKPILLKCLSLDKDSTMNDWQTRIMVHVGREGPISELWGWGSVGSDLKKAITPIPKISYVCLTQKTSTLLSSKVKGLGDFQGIAKQKST